MIVKLSLLTVAMLLVIPMTLGAQTRRSAADLPSARKLVEIKITGNTRYPHDQIVAASGLSVGSSSTDEDFKKASQRLGDTGLFSDISYAFSYSATGTKLELQLTDNDKLVPVKFENFVWFTPDELRSELRSRVPLFQGSVPVMGSLLEQLNDSLQALLLEHHIPGRVDYLRTAPEDGGEITGINFTVNDVNIVLQKISFTGAAAAEETALLESSKKVQGSQFKLDQISMYVNREWLPVFLQRGYLKASFGDPQVKVIDHKEQTTSVAVTMPVDPGAVYKTSAVEWTDVHVFPLSQLNSLLHLPTGEPANAMRLRADLDAAQKLYGTKGYMAALIRPESTLDNVNQTVAYTLHVSEGAQYKMGELEVQGLDTNSTTKVRTAWPLREGDPYDSSYAQHFLDEAIKVLPKNVTWSVDIHESTNEDDKTVDVSLKFSAKS
ncbi:MAG TPA: POTRA domain-containing protein [Terriglobales bacterium]|jgi:outer membrane protein assembly factor BamA|nr:POTRA domain-containing protein [Terriglobales bacterium]